MTEPPNFHRSYPLAGELIGPAWRRAWRVLSTEPTAWCRSEWLAEDMARAGVQAKTALGLLAKARKAGVLDVRYRKGGVPSRLRAEYRIARAYR